MSETKQSKRKIKPEDEPIIFSLHTNDKKSVKNLAELYHVSEPTIRRYLKKQATTGSNTLNFTNLEKEKKV